MKKLLIYSLFFLVGCGMQSIPTAKNQVEASLAEVTNQYKRRADLIPNLVKTVKACSFSPDGYHFSPPNSHLRLPA